MEHSDDKLPADLKARIKETYDGIASEYNKWTNRNDATRTEYLEKLLLLLRESQGDRVSILELGCGAGLPATKILLSLPQAIVVANDMSSEQIRLGRENLLEFGERVIWKEGDMMQLSFPESSLDAVVALYSLIHLPREEQTELVNKIAGWLKPGAHLLANFTSDSSEVNINPDWLKDDGWMFWSGWGLDRTIQIVESAGLEVVTKELRSDTGDAQFVWVVARKK